MKSEIFIIGAGGHARVVAEALIRQGISVSGFLEIDRKKIGKSYFDIPVLGESHTFDKLSPDRVRMINGIGGIGNTRPRQEVFERYKNNNFHFENIIHPSAIIAKHVELAEGVQILAGVVVNTGVQIGENSIVNTSSSIDHDCLIESHVHVAPGVILSGNVTIKTGAHIGIGARINQDTVIDKQAIVGSGAVVITNIEAGKTVVGIPARTIERN